MEEDERMNRAVNLFQELSLDEQIECLEEEIARREADIPKAHKLLRVLQRKRKKLN